MKKHKIVITQNTAQQRTTEVLRLISLGLAESDVVVELSRPKRSLDQNAKIHAMLGDIRKQATDTLGALVNGETKLYTIPLARLTLEAVKGFLVSRFVKECERSGVETKAKCTWIFDPIFQVWAEVRPSTTQFDKPTGSLFIEFLYSYGAEKGVRWSEFVLNG